MVKENYKEGDNLRKIEERYGDNVETRNVKETHSGSKNEDLREGEAPLMIAGVV